MSIFKLNWKSIAEALEQTSTISNSIEEYNLQSMNISFQFHSSASDKGVKIPTVFNSTFFQTTKRKGVGNMGQHYTWNPYTVYQVVGREEGLL